jgi:HK97 family phage prohead protease
MEKERRFNTAEFRVVSNDDSPTRIEGYAAVFNKDSEEMFGFRERIKPGAFASAIARPDDVRALINHDPNLVIGRNTAGTLKLSEDDRGLFFSCELPDTQAARDLAVSMGRGDISQCSFGFRCVGEEWEFNTSGPDIRTLTDVELFDVSPVTYPAYPDTSVAVRSREQAAKEQHNSYGYRCRLVEIEGAQSID